MDGDNGQSKRKRGNIHLSTAIHGTSDRLGKDIPTKSVPLVWVLHPVLPARLKEVRRGHEGVVPEDGSNSELVVGPIGQDKLLDLISQVGELSLDGRAKLICRQQAGRSVELDDRKALHQRLERLEGLREVNRGSLVRQEASRGGDGEGVQSMRHGGRVIMDMGEPLQGRGGGVGHFSSSHDDR